MSSPSDDRATSTLAPRPSVRRGVAVTYTRGGEVIDVAPGVALLDAALDQGVDMDHGCRAGACGACAVEVLEGLENADAPDPIEQDTRRRCELGERGRLACRMTCRGPMTVRPFDDD